MSDADDIDPDSVDEAIGESDPPDSDAPDSEVPSSDGLGGVLGEDGALLLDDVEVRDLLRGALREPRSGRGDDILDDVQRQLREQTDGRYFADGWATSEDPRGVYLVTSALILGALVVLYLLLTPVWP